MEFLDTYFKMSKTISTLPYDEVAFGMKFYFNNDFPAYYDNHELIVTTVEGQYAVAQLEGMEGGECVVLPIQIAEYIRSQI